MRPAPASTSGAGTPSATRVRSPEALIGRDTELALLADLLTREEPVVNVTGPVGVGKSALIRAALDEVAGSREVVHLDLTDESPQTAVDGLRRRLSRLPVPRRHRGLASVGTSPVLYLERADVLARVARELVELVPPAVATVVVESLPALRDPRIAMVPVGALSEDAAAELFRRRAHSLGVAVGTDAATSAYLRRVIVAVDANPFAIELVAARLPFLPLSALAASLETPERALATLSVPHPVTLDARPLRTGLADSHRSTAAASRRLLDLLSVFTGSFTIDAVEAVWPGDPSECFDALSELVELRLVHIDEDSGRCRLGRLVRDFAAERVAGSALENEARSRHADHYGDVARRAAQAHDDADEDAALALLGTDYPEALAALRWLRDRDPLRALRLGADLGWEADRRGGSAALVEALEALVSRRYAGDEPARRDALLWLVKLASWSPLGADRVVLIRARLAEAFELATRLGDPLAMLHALRVQFVAIAAHGDLATALDACGHGAELAAAIGHPRWLARFEIAQSAIHALGRDVDLAVSLAGAGLARAIRAGDRQGTALGALALHAMPATKSALPPDLPALEDVLDIFRAHGDQQNELHALAILAQESVERGEAHVAARWLLTRQDRVGRSDLLNGLTVSVMLGVHVARLCGEPEISARLHGSVASHMEPLLPILSPRHVEQYSRGLDSVRGALGPDRFDAAVAGGRLLDREQTLLELVDLLGSVVDAPSAGSSAEPMPPTVEPVAGGGLTPRERQVLGLLARGLRNKEIAAELGLSPKSVMHHTGSIYRRLGVRSRTEAVATAARQGLVTID